MKKLLVLSFLFFGLAGFSQTDAPAIFTRLSESMKNFVPDTSAVPNDKLSQKIKELRVLKGGFNINEAIQYKLAEAKSKNEMTEAEYQKINSFLTTGKGKQWLDNSVIWIYRKLFTLAEVNELIRFYKTSAGQKMANEFPVILAQSSIAAEKIIEDFKKKNTGQ